MATRNNVLSATHVSADITTRHTDVKTAPQTFYVNTPLPVIDWKKINQEAPKVLPLQNRQPDDPLPYADWVIITWTSAEWQALDHVFINSDKESSADKEWRNQWQLYTRGAEKYHADSSSGSLWGYFKLVEITDMSKRPWRVLLFKSNAHLAHAPWVNGLTAMLQYIIEDTKAGNLYTIGTAGGARLNQQLGDSVITNTAILELQRPQNTIDKDNGNAFRCPTWYPSTNLINAVETNLLLKLNTVATDSNLEKLFKELQAKHADSKVVKNMHLADLLNNALDPKELGRPEIQSLKDVPLLTTDFYYIATGESASAYAFLEMDDAVIASVANELSVRFACIRNISDPVVPSKTKSGETINDNVRGDWSGLIYSNFGLYTSFNSALATWATIAGEGSRSYNPKRNTESPSKNDPLEIELVYEVRSCGTCDFFWPKDKQKAVYGPYTSFDFDSNIPYVAQRPADAVTAPWVLGRTSTPSFPNAEIVDGCRKAPIMTIGINPNLTAFAPGTNGAAWAYPNFNSNAGTDAWTKYAWYYRYRSVYQEKLSLDFVKQFIIPETKILAYKDGYLVSATRTDESPAWQIKVRYDGDTVDTTVVIPGKTGAFPYMLFVDSYEGANRFKEGDVLAAEVAVPEGIRVEIDQMQQTYYMQFVPTLKSFEYYLKDKGHSNANLAIGEDVSQLDMVACASPHWTEGYLGNQMPVVVNNCVSKNAWAIKQFVQSRPAVLFIVSESSWNMFYNTVGNFVDKGIISQHPVDQSFTLLNETTNLDKPVYIRFDVKIDGVSYQSKTRLVITPHFSFNTNFYPQFRLSPTDYKRVSEMQGYSDAITKENGFTILPEDPQHPGYYREIQLQSDTAYNSIEKLKNDYPDLYHALMPYYINAHEKMAAVLKSMYDNGELTYDEAGNYLNRTAGACKFCVNDYWQFPGECKYGKNKEAQPAPGYLKKVAEYIVAHGKPSHA